MKLLLPIVSCVPLLAGCGTTVMTMPELETRVAFEITLTPMWSATSRPLD